MKGEILSKHGNEYIICAANWFNDGVVHIHQPKNIVVGFVVCGRRHHNCYYTASICLADTYNEMKVTCKQGFLTSWDRFVNRTEAAKIAFDAKQINKKTDYLFSEDLY